jgi:drug/metabolite transporter (DMT)-like permease
MKDERTGAMLAALAAAALYGLNVPLSKLLLEKVPAALMAALLYLGAGFGMLAVRLARRAMGRAGADARIARADLPFVAGMVLLDAAAPILLMMGLAVAWGLENNCTRMLSLKDPTQIVAIKGLGSGAVSLGLAHLLGQGGAPLGYALAAMALGFVCYGLSIALYVLAQRTLGAARTSACYAVAPFVGVALSAAIFGQRFEPPFLLALAVMIVGAYFAASERHRHAHVHEALAHEHRHSHADGHHTHAHGAPVAGAHSHFHTHEPVEHTHSHTPDLHHTHPHP